MSGVSLGHSSLHFFGTKYLTDQSSLTLLGWLANELQRSAVCTSSYKRSHKCSLLHLSFMWVLEVWIQVLMLLWQTVC